MNIYIKNHEEIKAIGEGKNSENRCVMVGVALDMFENIHGLKHDAYARAEYVEKYAPASLIFGQKKLLHPEQSRTKSKYRAVQCRELSDCEPQ